jgi:VWFA-related protein
VWLNRALASITCIVAGWLLVANLRAQDPATPPQQEQRPTFRVGANLVRVDVTVIDRRGEPVTDLTQDDFEIREDGVPQTVETFKLVEATGEAPDDLSLPIRSPEHALAEAARDEIRVFVIFWDEYHIGQLGAAIEGRKALSDFVHNAFGPADLVALIDQLTPLDAIRFTRDRLELTEAVRKLKGRQGIYLPPRSAMEEGQLMRMRDIEQLRAQVTASALEATIAHLGTIREGRKAILFVSQDIGALPREERYQWLDRAIRFANTNNTVIYTLDPRGLMINGGMSDVLQALALDTGGRWFQSNNPAPKLRDIVKEARAFYLLGYTSSLNPADGKFHRIKVNVKRPGVDVHARNGYLAPAPTDIASERARAAAAVVPPDVERALAALQTVRPDTAGDLWVGATRGVNGEPRVTIAWTPRAEKAVAAVMVRATALDGTVCFNATIPGGGATFTCPPGRLSIQRTLLDADGAAADRETSTFDVPAFIGSLSMSTPTLHRARNGIELRSLTSRREAAPYAGHVFDRTDRLVVRFSLFGTASADATVTATLLSRAGVALSALPLANVPDRPGEYLVQFPLASVSRGDYVIAIEASYGELHRKALVPFHAS